MIVLCTDFGLEGPYTGQVKAVLARAAPAVPVIDLFADLPPFRPQAAAYLLAAYGLVLVAGDVIVAVVDPGVGGARAALALEADGRWYVGPDNGIFELVLRRAHAARSWRIDWRPTALSATFHGRDLFAPVAAGRRTKLRFASPSALRSARSSSSAGRCSACSVAGTTPPVPSRSARCCSDSGTCCPRSSQSTRIRPASA